MNESSLDIPKHLRLMKSTTWKL